MRKILRYAGKLTQVLITALLAFLLACNLYLIIMEHIVGVEYPAVFGYSTAVVASGSMEPELSVDDLILNHAQTSYQEGDIITFQNGSSLTTHRIVEVTGEGYVTQGDANNTADPELVVADAVIGRVTVAVPYVGRAISFLRTPFGMTILIFTGLIIIELPFFFRKQKEQTDGEELSNEYHGTM